MKRSFFFYAWAALALVAALSAFAQNAVSERAARVLQEKIDAIQAAETKGNTRPPETITVSEVELESYVLYEMRDEIPARMDSFDVQLSEGAVAADTRLTFAPDATANPVLDLLIAGTHVLFVKGKLAATGGRGRFELQEVKVDGIPVPTILVETLIARYVKPKYPDVDLNKDFAMPWGIDALTITPGRATIVY
jgi:hypothetical protein